MSDVFSKEERSEIMRSVKSRNTKSTELAMIKLFKDNNITGNVLIELDDTTGLTMEAIDMLPDDVSVRIIGSYIINKDDKE